MVKPNDPWPLTKESDFLKALRIKHARHLRDNIRKQGRSINALFCAFIAGSCLDGIWHEVSHHGWAWSTLVPIAFGVASASVVGVHLAMMRLRGSRKALRIKTAIERRREKELRLLDIGSDAYMAAHGGAVVVLEETP